MLSFLCLPVCTLLPGAAVCTCTHVSRAHLGPRVADSSFVGFCCCSYVFVCLFAFFKLGTTDLSSICTPSSPWKTFQRAGRKAPVQLKATPLLFLGGLDWFAPKWLQPVSDSTGSSSGLVLTRWRVDTCWQCVPLLQRVESVLNSDSSSHCIVLSMSQGFLAEIRAVFKIRK